MVSEKMDKSKFFMKTMVRNHGGESCLALRRGSEVPTVSEDGRWWEPYHTKEGETGQTKGKM